jgi:hypothetical protein
MSKTYAQLRQGLSERLHDYYLGTASAGTKNSLVDASLLDRPTKPSEGQFVLLVSGTYAGQKRRISQYIEREQRIIWERPLAGAVAAADTYEIHSLDTDDYLDAINHARLAIYPYVYKEIDDWTMVSRANQYKYTLPTTLIDGPFEVYLGRWAPTDIEDQLLTNGDFNDWDSSSDPSDWDTPTSLTLAQEDDWILESPYSCKCSVALSTAGSLYQTVSTPSTWAGQRVSFSIWVYCMTASRVKAAIYDTSATEGTAHAGGGWEQLTVSYNVPSAPTLLKAGVTVTSGTAISFYLSDAVLWSGQRIADEPGNLIVDWRTPINGVIEFPYALTSGRPIRVKGIGYLESVSADSDTVTISDPQTDLLYAEAACYVYRQLISKSPAQIQSSYITLLQIQEVEAARLRGRVAMSAPVIKRNLVTWRR